MAHPAPDPPAPTVAYVCFSNDCNHPVGRWLHPGFRHVFVIVWSILGGGWVGLEMDVETGPRAWAAGHPGDLAERLSAAGWCVLRVERPARPARRSTPLMLATCVSQAKFWLNINAPLVITPRQLYRHLMAHGAVEVT